MEKKKKDFDKFNDTMDKLLSVPYSELKKRLDEEKEGKAKKKPKTSSSAREVSDERSES